MVDPEISSTHELKSPTNGNSRSRSTAGIFYLYAKITAPRKVNSANSLVLSTIRNCNCMGLFPNWDWSFACSKLSNEDKYCVSADRRVHFTGADWYFRPTGCRSP